MVYNKEYYLKNKTRITTNNKLWRQANQEHLKTYRKQYWFNNKNVLYPKHKEYLIKNRLKWKSKEREYRIKNKTAVIKYYSKSSMSCVCCGEDLLGLLTIDHINNNGVKHRIEVSGNKRGPIPYLWFIRNGFPDGFQVLCYNCNCGRYRNRGICPHQEILDRGLFYKHDSDLG